jgi:hypothetical protein
MKKLLAILLLTISASASAQHHGHRWNHGHGHGHRSVNNWGWIAPAVIGGAVVYAATRPYAVVQQPPSVVYVPQPNQLVVPYAAPQGFHWEQILDANCNCYRLVLVQG